MFKTSIPLAFFIVISLSYSLFAMHIETVDSIKKEKIDQALATQTHVKFNILITDETAKYIAYKLRHNKQVKSLNLSYQAISTQGASYIANALQQNCQLEELYLNGNPIGDEGVGHLARALETNETLQKLELIFCGIGNIGIEHLTTCLSRNAALKELGLDSRKISTENWVLFKLILDLKNNRS